MAGIAGLVLAALMPLGAQTPEARAIWVTRWDYKTAEDVEHIIENCADLNFNVVLFQTRGNGTVFYRSEIEPWAWELTSDGPETTGQDPGWDPLELAVRLAHERGIELHSYMNVFPAWRTQQYAPRDSGQLWWEHPDWFMADAAGERMLARDRSVPPNRPDWYTFISPGVPEVQDYIASVFEEVAKNYEIDGIHFDYIRYPFEIHEVEEGYEERQETLGNWSFDARSLARFQQETGIAAPDLDPQAWTDWRVEQITTTVRKTRELVDAAREGVMLSAAVFPDVESAYNTKCQDYIGWMEEGLLDCAMSMGYTASNELFRTRTEGLMEHDPGVGHIVPGLSLGNDFDTVNAQIGMAREMSGKGFAGFAYSHLFDRDNGHVRNERGDALAEGPLAEAAPLPW
jgi:uncharacterized lipoprotein YddW (UPF0748 family)